MLPRKGMLLALVLSLTALVTLSRAQNSDSDNEEVSTSQARIVRLSYAEGNVQLSTDHGTENATMNQPVTEGASLTTGSDGWAEVQLEDGSTIRLAPESQLAFTELGRSSSGATLTTVDLSQGEALFKVSRRHDDQFAVTVRSKTVLLEHSGRFRVTATNQDPLEIAVFKGEVSMKDSDSGQQVTVKKGETFTLDAMDSSHYALDKGVEADELDQWSEQRDTTLSAYAAKGAGNDAQSPYQYGLSDLNYYGGYYDVPGYGYLWQPYGIGVGWDPFMNGYWNYSPYGYCWVSAYPWGWMPYRYGRWIFVPGRGWMWQAGGWNNWWRGPHVVGAPPGFRPPSPPPVRIGVRNLNPRMPTHPRRVFTNEDVERKPPEIRPERPLEPGNGSRIGSGEPIRAEREPGMVPRQTPEAQTPHRQNPGTGRVGETRRGPDRTPSASPRTEPPVNRAHPAPATVPSRSSSPPAPHVSSPPPAPRSYSPPPAPRSESSHSSTNTSPGRPK